MKHSAYKKRKIFHINMQLLLKELIIITVTALEYMATCFNPNSYHLHANILHKIHD